MKKLIFISLALLLSACNMSATISEIEATAINAIPSQKLGGATLNSGAIHTVSSSGYIVESSVGNIQSQTKVISSGGYQVYLNLEGQSASE